MHVFTIPGPPKGKGRPRFVRATGHTFTDAQTASYEAKVGTYARAAGIQPISEPVGLIIHAVLPRPKRLLRRADPDGEMWAPSRPDLDNLVKAILDGLNGIAWVDDAQVVEIVARKLFAAKGAPPEVRVSIRTRKENP